MDMKTRGYSTDIRHHEGLLFKMAKRFHGRLVAAKVIGVDFDDVMGELRLAFHIASQGYKPELGYTFTALLGVSCQNHFNKFAGRLMREQFGRDGGEDDEALDAGPRKEGLGYMLFGDMEQGRGYGDSDGDDFSSSLADLVVDEDGLRPDEATHDGMVFASVMTDKTLLPETRAYIAYLTLPDFPMTPQIAAKVRKRSEKVRDQIMARWGVQLRSVSIDTRTERGV